MIDPDLSFLDDDGNMQEVYFGPAKSNRMVMVVHHFDDSRTIMYIDGAQGHAHTVELDATGGVPRLAEFLGEE
jgi:hypothetical protein